MRLQIIDTNFTNNFDWLFMLSNEHGGKFYIMNQIFYSDNKLKSPITKKELDNFDRGTWINAIVEHIDDKDVVVQIR
jgi:hypothetical protein